MFDAILCLNTNLPNKEFFLQYPNTPIYAADGGAKRLLALDVTPQAILGDGDSIAALPEAWRQLWVSLPDQDYTDFEKSLQYLLALGLHKILVLGMHGGEIDHTLHNLALLVQYSQQLQLVGVDALAEPYCWLYPLLHSASFKANKNKRASLIPFPQARITTSGFKWDLQNTLLELLAKVSVRNIVDSDEINITLHSGELLLILQEYVDIIYHE